MKRQRSSKGRRKKGDTARLAARLAPLEELETGSTTKQLGVSPELKEPQANNHYGAIVVDNNSLNLPEDMVEGSDGGKFLGMEPVVLVILGVMLAFIAFIAWQISLMPTN
ncbi:MAG TPA: hypothetical protein VIF64_06680 [Pyrinomonadaceae bacterium]|jgi:hypothetical protein